MEPTGDGGKLPDPDARMDHGVVRYSVLSVRAMWLAVAVIVLVGAALTVWLLLAVGTGGDRQRLQLEVIKTAGTIVVGIGGAVALLLAARRQRSTEIALKQKDRDHADIARAYRLQEQIAGDARADAAARRITELYTKAAEQLGSDKAPVRLAGMYALERLAQDNEDQRQTVVNVLCAYLRMPSDLPGERPADTADERIAATHRERMQERDVRLTAQRLLVSHLQPGGQPSLFYLPAGPPQPGAFWADIDLDLTGAVLIDFNLPCGSVRRATFHSVSFIGRTSFAMTSFASYATFDSATFADFAFLGMTTFTGMAGFGSVTFTDTAHFERATFAGSAFFRKMTVNGATNFKSATFASTPVFKEATFVGPTTFESVNFQRSAEFEAATFGGDVPTEVAPYLPTPGPDAIQD